MRRHYFGHAEISEQCIEWRGIDGAYHEALRRLFVTYRQMVVGRMFDENKSGGRIVLSVGWLDADNNISQRDRAGEDDAGSDDPARKPTLIDAAIKLRNFAEKMVAVLRHKEIRPPMNPGIQESLERQGMDACDAFDGVIALRLARKLHHDWCANPNCEICNRRHAAEKQFYDDSAASGGIVDAP